jgi:hypothetical protein
MRYSSRRGELHKLRGKLRVRSDNQILKRER